MSVYGTDVYGTAVYFAPGAAVTGTGSFQGAASAFAGTASSPTSSQGAFAARPPTFAGTGRAPVKAAGGIIGARATFGIGAGWGLAEWGTSTWGEGADYVYNPTVFLDAEGVLALLQAQGRLEAYAALGRLEVFAGVGVYIGPREAIGVIEHSE